MDAKQRRPAPYTQTIRPEIGHTGLMYAVATTELNGHAAAIIGGEDQMVRGWDLTTGRQIGEPLTGHTNSVCSVAVTELNGQPIAITCSNDNTVRMWEPHHRPPDRRTPHRPHQHGMEGRYHPTQRPPDRRHL
ncbi:hypothetical protein [Nonomuraea bangladeshensis]|uniref:WD40 repeat domain-containing protein n=1 Tax=Nonomuraea bangladeshensis TaxID=404385 RepID=UPI0031DE7409